jgi:pimeloyl-ACP methyl ester carboxylesterase
MAAQHWPALTPGPPRGRVLLIHGLSSIADSWWRIGPGLAERGWAVSAVDQAGHGGRALEGEVSAEQLADAVRAVHPVEPDVLIGHSLGTVTALGLLERDRGWAGTVILEEPPSDLGPETYEALAGTITDDVDAVHEDRRSIVDRVRRDCPHWADEDVHWAVQGIAEMDPEPFARRFHALARGEQVPDPTPDRVLALAPAAYVLAARSSSAMLDGGSALLPADREALARRLPDGHLIEIEGGHCLHRDAPAEWLAAVGSILG